MGDLRQSGAGHAVNDPPDAADLPSGAETLARTAAHREERRRKAAARRKRRRRLLVLGVLIVLLSPAIYSYAHWMLRPSSTPFFANSVEWVRADFPFGNQVVDEIEHIYYTWNAPSKGGPQLTSLPQTGQASGSSERTAAMPPRIKPVFHRALPGEGVWKPTGPPVRGGPPVLVTTFRPETDYPRNVAYLAWYDHTRTDLAYYPGRYEPPSTAVRGPAMVPESQRRRLLATFNAGFIHSDVNNGSTDNGRVNEPLAQGNATLIGYRDGRVAIKIWHGGPNAGPDVAWSRQSLPPIIWHRTTQPQPQRQLAVGLHGRQRGPRLAHRRRHRPPRQPDLRGGGRHDGDLAGPGPAARRGGPGDAVRHQCRLAHPDHLHPPPRPSAEPDRAVEQARRPLPHPRRPRLLRGLSPPARCGHGPL